MPGRHRWFLCLILVSLLFRSGHSSQICTFLRSGQTHGRVAEVDIADPVNQEELKKSLRPIAKMLGMIRLDAPSEFSLFNQKGESVSSILECPTQGGRLYLLREGEIWTFPGVDVGVEDKVSLGDGKNITVRTLSISPKILVFEDLVGKEEAEEIVAASRGTLQKNGVFSMGLTGDQLPVVNRIKKRLAEMLRVPADLFDYGSGFELSVSPPSEESSKGDHINIKRDFYLKPDFESIRDEIDRGKNTLMSITIFLNTLEPQEEGAIFFPMTNERQKKMLKMNSDGSLAVNIDPGAKACRPEDGLLIRPKQGAVMVVYHLAPEGQMNGKVDPTTLYQLCSNLKSERWLINTRIPNKTFYSPRSSSFLSIMDKLFYVFFGTDFTQSVLMNGYGWDWQEEPKGHFSHNIPDLKGRHEASYRHHGSGSF